MWENPKRIESAIKRLTREIEEIDSYFYGQSESDDRILHAGMLERKRDDMVRSIVLQMHTSVENLLNSCITLNISGNTSRRSGRSQSDKALRKMLYGQGSLGFEMKLNLALALRLINGKTKERLGILNTLRNKCSHNWILNVTVRHKRRPAQKKPPLLSYEGRDLHRVDVLKDFIDEYSRIYLKLFIKAP